MFIGIKAIAQGSDHTSNGENIPCQDAASFAVIEYGKDRVESAAIAVAADGHGSPAYFRSDVGADLGVNSAIHYITGFLKSWFSNKTAFFSESREKTAIEEALKTLEDHILSKWRQAAKNHFENHSISPEEKIHCQKHTIKIDPKNDREIYTLYGSTLVALVIAKDFWFNLQLGDGWCIIFEELGKGKGASPYTHDSNNITDSLCQGDPKFKHYFGLQRLMGGFVMTDGVTESFPTGEQGLLDWVNHSVFPYLIEKPETIEEQLQTVIRKRAKSWGDDGSIAGVFDYAAAAGLFVARELAKSKKNAQDSMPAERTTGEALPSDAGTQKE